MSVVYDRPYMVMYVCPIGVRSICIDAGEGIAPARVEIHPDRLVIVTDEPRTIVVGLPAPYEIWMERPKEGLAKPRGPLVKPVTLMPQAPAGARLN